MITINLVFKLLGSLALLIFGMKMMSEALQKLTGSSLRHTLAKMTANRLTGMLTGAFVTCAVQSSSATTVMTVSFVSAGMLTLAQAISIIMGANIGTTLTAWIMSLGYNFDLSNVVFPSFLIGMVLIYKKRQSVVGDLLFGLGFLFWSLVMLSTTGKSMNLEQNPDIMNFFASFDTNSYFTINILGCRNTDNMYCTIFSCSDGYHHLAMFYRCVAHILGCCFGNG